jgi:hypothetical protein
VIEPELMNRKQVSEWLGVSQRRIAEAHHDIPPIPYVRVFRKVYYFRTDIIGWLRRIQEQTDSTAVDVRRARSQLAGGKR